MNITKKETAVIINIMYNEMNAMNYGRPENEMDSQTWSSAVYDLGAYQKLIENPKGLGGVVASLSKKDLVWIFEDGSDTTVQLSDKGFTLFNELFPTTQDVDNYYEAETGVSQNPTEGEIVAAIIETIEEKEMTEVAMNRAEAHKFFNRGPLFKGVGKTEHLFEAMLKSANSGRRMSIATLMNKYSWTERRAKDVIRYNCSASNMSASFDSKWVTISWK